MTLKTRLARAEQAARSKWRRDLSHMFDGVVLPATGDRLGFFMEHFPRVYALVGEDWAWRERSELMRPLTDQLMAEELGELAPQHPWTGAGHRALRRPPQRRSEALHLDQDRRRHSKLSPGLSTN